MYKSFDSFTFTYTKFARRKCMCMFNCIIMKSYMLKHRYTKVRVSVFEHIFSCTFTTFMRVYLYVCMCMCMCVCVHRHTHTCVKACERVQYACRLIYVRVSMYVRVYSLYVVRTGMVAHVFARIRLYTFVCIRTCLCCIITYATS